ncbi:MAG: hypothetical protein CMQ34_09055 [Gammaproteobacteria bacterium]|nr:hypothetical protein [Gammaproteobacteria bacterium]
MSGGAFPGFLFLDPSRFLGCICFLALAHPLCGEGLNGFLQIGISLGSQISFTLFFSLFLGFSGCFGSGCGGGSFGLSLSCFQFGVDGRQVGGGLFGGSLGICLGFFAGSSGVARSFGNSCFCFCFSGIKSLLADCCFLL